MFTEILNPFLNVRNKIKNKNGEWVDQRETKESLHLAADYKVPISGEYENVIFNEPDNKVIVDNITVYSSANVYFELGKPPFSTTFRYDTNILHTIHESGRSYASMDRIKAHGNEYFNYEEIGDDKGKITLKHPIILPNGAQLKIFNDDGSAFRDGELTYKVVYRVIEG